MEFVIFLFSVIVLFCAFIPSESYEEHVIKFMAFVGALGFFAWSIYTVSYDNGIKDGACNQLRGKYEVTYVINKDSCVVDTIINIKWEQLHLKKLKEK